MPIPFILGAAAVGAGLFGAKKAYDAHETNERAERMNRNASRIVDSAKESLDQERKRCQNSLENLGRKKINSLEYGINPFVDAFEKIHSIDFQESAGLNELSKFKITKEELAEMKEMGSLVVSMGSGAVGGIAAGSLAALGAYGAAMTLGVASTGAAISGLAGVAATNATLAFLGGGSLAAGGLGMAGGMAVLGGLVAGPALAVMGLVLGSKAEENLENARANRAEAEKIEEQCKTAAAMCISIKNRCDLFANGLEELAGQLASAVNTLNSIVKRYADGSGKADYRKFSANEKNSVSAAAALAKAIKSILDTPILDKDGKLTFESERMAARIENHTV